MPPITSAQPAKPLGQPVSALDGSSGPPKSMIAQMVVPMKSECTTVGTYGRSGWKPYWMAAMARQKAITCSMCCSLATQSIFMPAASRAAVAPLQPLAFLLHQPLAQAAAGSQQEHRDAVQAQAQPPAQQRVDRPRAMPEAVAGNREHEQVDHDVHRCVHIPAELGAGTLVRDALDFFGGQRCHGAGFRQGQAHFRTSSCRRKKPTIAACAAGTMLRSKPGGSLSSSPSIPPRRVGCGDSSEPCPARGTSASTSQAVQVLSTAPA